MKISRHKLLSLELSTGKFEDFVETIMNWSRQRQSTYVCVSNVHMCIEAWDDKAFGAMVNAADLVTPDGMPLVLATKWYHGIKTDRVAGMDLLPALLGEAEKEDLSIYFYGGSQAMLDATRDYLKEKHPNLNKLSFESPPFRALNDAEKEETLERINASGAQMVFVVLGCPKQERWMAEHKSKINACMLGIGGALPVMVGMQKRAPKWMQKTSMEWLYRLMQEPRRLFKRYFYTNLKFMWLFALAMIRKPFTKKMAS